MKLSTKGRYGIAAMYDLAIHHGQGPVSLKSIAQRQMISEHYLEQLIGMLRKTGYVKSVRGAQGGYALAKDPRQISVGDIIKVMEGPIAPVDCLLTEPADSSACSRVGICVARGVLSKVRDSINAVLDSVSLADLCAENKDENKENKNKGQLQGE